MFPILCALLAAAAGCERASEQADVVRADSTVGPLPTAEELQIPEHLAAVIRESPAITVCLTGGQILLEPVTEPAIHHAGPVWYRIRSALEALTPDQASRLRELLFGIRKYQGVPPDCTFQADVAYRFASGTDSLRVLVCHSCGEMRIAGVQPGWGTILTDQRQPLVEFTHELFPRDERIERIRTGELRM
jgi:hypothetical protein